MPAPPDASSNFAQPWSYSNERDVFGTLRGEWDINSSVTGWAAYGWRRSDEANSLANFDLVDSSGAGTTSRFDNTREDSVGTGEIGLRGKLRTGSVGHEWVVSASSFDFEKKNAYAWDFNNRQATNLYNPVYAPLPGFTAGAFRGGNLAAPNLTGRTKLTSFAIGDTLALVNDSLLLTLGARHQSMQVTDYAYGTSAVTNDYDKSRTSPVVGAVWKASKEVSLYANYIEGLSKGDVAPLAASNRGESLAPYVSKQKEIGAKYDGGRFGGGLALFSTTKPRSMLTASSLFTDGGEDRHDGLELNFFGEPTRGLRLLGGATWLDATQQSTGSATTDGKRVIGVPRLQATVGAEWDIPGAKGLAVDGRLNYTGSRYANAANTLEVGSWTRVDAGVRYLTDVNGKLLTLRGRVDNLADRNYWASSGGYPGNGYLVVGAPRTFTVSATVDF